MANPVQRLRYFDGEYLRSYDFTDEQSYHIAMRRLMNRRLHLHGIVYGLEIVQDQDSVLPSGPFFFSIAPGMAIDNSGREIVVTSPYSLTNVLTSPNLHAGTSYEVWVCYQENETGLPAAGYMDCNVQNQNTRWQESFQVQLIPATGPSVVTPCGGVRVGMVTLIHDLSSVGLAIQGPVSPQTYNVKRHYVGIRAQRVIAPDQIDPDSFDLSALATPLPDQPLPGYLDVHPGVFHEGNVIVKKNLVVGDDFKLDKSVNKNLPDLTTLPPGSVKITQDLFLQGDFYGFVNGDWSKLKDYILTLMPNTVIGNPALSIAIPPSTTTSATVHATIQTVLSSVSQVQVFLSVTEIDWVDEGVLASWAGAGPITIAVNATTPTNTTGKTWDIPIQWTVSPSVHFGAGDDRLPITKLVVNYMVVFTPS
jgi:hypothetical protein